MISGSVFQELGAVIDGLEAKEMTVLDVTTEHNSLVTDGRLSVEMTVGLNCLSELSTDNNIQILPSEADGADELATTMITVEIPVKTNQTASQSTSDKETLDSQQGLSEVDVSRKSDTFMDGEEAEDTMDERGTDTMKQDSEDTEDNVPYYKNYDLLARVYEEHDTFAEMTEALGVDVTSATVRQHMVNHGIHPSSSDDEDSADRDNDKNEGASDIDAREEDIRSVTIEADGYGLPDSVSMDSIIEAVQQSRTLYEVQTELGLDRSTTRKILTDFNLLELVTTRLTDDHSTEVEEVVDRIHSASMA